MFDARTHLKKSLHWIGSTFAILGIFFVVLRLRNYSAQINFSLLNAKELIVIGGFMLIYGLSNLMLVQAWHRLLAKFGAHVNYLWAVQAYGISQLAKYVPGNIFHLAGRQAIGMAAGVQGWSLAKSTVWELGLLTLTGAVFGILALPLLVPSVPLPYAILTWAVTVLITIALLSFYFGRQAAHAFIGYVCFFVVSAGIFAGTTMLISHSPLPISFNYAALGGAYVLAWLVGFVTPGAPAGLGIREIVLLFLLKGLVSEADLLLVIVLCRVITVSGDCLFFAIASLLNGGKKMRFE